MLPRLQLVELEDLAWFPRVIRDLATDYLEFIEAALMLHRPVVPLLARALRESGARRIIDLCSGGGGPIRGVVRELAAEGLDVDVLLSDRYPNLDAFERARAASDGSIGFVPEPVDARDVPRTLDGFRTVFNAFHHFAPTDAKAVLRSAVEASQPIGVFEIPQRSITVLLATLLAPLMVLVSTPFIRPFRWRRLLWTYVIPLVPLTCLWDGVVSQLRAYHANELEQLARDVSGGYAWTSGVAEVRGVPARLTYLIGMPARTNDAARDGGDDDAHEG